MGAVAVAILVAFAAVGAFAAFVVSASGRTVEDNVAPSLIAVQGLSSSVAEANANATAAFLSASSGPEDRQRRVAYQASIERSARQAEELASLIGDDQQDQTRLQDVAAALVTYSGLIESSRTAQQNGSTTAVDELRSAIDLTAGEVSTSIDAVTVANQNTFDDEVTAARLPFVATGALGMAALAFLLWLQVRISQRSRRTINLGLAFATIMVVAALGVVASSYQARQSTLERSADGGYDTIAATSRLQTAAYDVQTRLSLALLGTTVDGDVQASLDQLVAESEQIRAAADSDRERAAADALQVRLDRYQASAIAIADLAAVGRRAEADVAFRGTGLSDFNGLNMAIEGVLSDNRTQFTDGVGEASDATRLLPYLMLGLPLLAVIGSVIGVQRRLRDYQ